MINVELPACDLSEIPAEQTALANVLLRQISLLQSQINQANRTIEASDVYVTDDKTLADLLSGE